jgi:hypothetical protein
MRLSSPLPVAMMFFKHWHTDDTEVGVVIAKAQFRRQADGVFRAAGVPDWRMEDVFAGDPAWTPLVAEQDIAPGKVGCDLIVTGVARAPGGRARRDWPVGVAIAGRLTYGFHVRGPSQWERQAKRWVLTDPAAVAEVPLTYALAYGGASPRRDGAPPDVFEGNPAGLGHAGRHRLDAGEPFPAPQIGDLAEFIAADPTQAMMVHGTGPVAKAWMPRRSFAGTFDAAWRDLRHPRMPHDYSLRFWNAAPRPLQIEGGLLGNEVVRLAGMSATLPDLACPLPCVQLWLVAAGGAAATMSLDTVAIDVSADDPLDHAMTLVWRQRLVAPFPDDAAIHSQDLEPNP